MSHRPRRSRPAPARRRFLRDAGTLHLFAQRPGEELTDFETDEIAGIESLPTITSGEPAHATGPFAGRAEALEPIGPAWSPLREFGGCRG